MDMLLEFIGVFILLFVVIVLFAILIFVYIKMSPFIPYLIAKIMKKDILICFMKNGAVKLLPASYNSGVYTVDDSTYNWQFIKKDSSMIRIGDRPAALAIDRWGITVNPYLILSIQELQKKGIMNYEMLDNTLKAEKSRLMEIYQQKQLTGEKVTMADYKNAGIILSQQDIICNGFDVINFDLISNYTSGITPPSVKAAINEEIAKRIKNFNESNRVETKKSGGIDMVTIIIIIGMIFAGLAILHSQGFI